MSRKDQVSEEDLGAFLGNLQGFSSRNREVLAERIAQPLEGHITFIRIDHLDPDPQQPRKHFAEESLRDLSDSIRDQGVLQPIVVRPGAERRFLIVAGERRFQAARRAGMDTVPCIVHQYSDEQAALVALMENLHRDDLTDIEKSDALRSLKDLTRRTWDDLAQLVRLSPDRVKHLARLDGLAEPVKEQVRTRVLSGRKARFLLSLPPSEQVIVGQRAAVENWSAERLQEHVRGAQLHPSRNTRKTDSTKTDEGVARNTSVMINTVETPRHTPLAIADLQRALTTAIGLLDSAGGADVLSPALRETLLAQVEQLRTILLGR